MVRLTESTQSVLDLSSTFQFHYGAINGSSQCFTTSPIYNFNSTMVRLTEKGFRKEKVPFDHFNSTMVRLTDVQIVKQLLSIHHFNSTMVRLTAAFVAVRHAHNLFQFHYGAINGQGAATSPAWQGYFNSTMVRLTADFGLNLCDIKVFIVVTPTHLYEVRRPGAAWKIDFNSREADVQWEAAAKLADELMTKLVQRHEISWKDREAEFFHYIWSAFFQMNEIKYVRKKHED